MNRGRLLMLGLFQAAIWFFIITAGYHAFGRSHPDLANVSIGASVGVSLLCMASFLWKPRRAPSGDN